MICKVCLATGARLTEAETMARSELSPNKLFFLYKSGKNMNVPIPERLYDELREMRGRMFKTCYQIFQKMLATTIIQLIEVQNTYILRRTFASHFLMNCDNILVLQSILGYANIREIMKYTHFVPGCLEEAVMLNLLSELKRLNNE